MPSAEKKKISLLFAVYLVLLLITAFIVGRAFMLVNAADYSSIREFENDWSANVSGVSLAEIKQDVMFTNTLPSVTSADILFFRAKNIIVSVYIDGVLVSDVGAEEMRNAYGYKAPGTYFVSVPLKEEYSDKPVIIKVESPYTNDSSCNIKGVCIGSSRLILQKEINGKLISFSLCIALICIGLIYLVVALPLRKFLKSGIRLMYLGCFSFVFGVWSLTETKLLQLLFGNSAFMHLITSITLMLIVLPLFLFFKSNYKVATMGATDIVTTVTFCFFFVSLIVHALGIADLHELITLAHIVIIVGVIFTLYYAVLDGIRTKFKSVTVIGLFSLAICALLDVIGYWLQVFQDNSMLIRIGVLIYMGALGYDVICEYIKVYNLNLKSKLLHKMAYYDMLTEAHNRTAFTTDMRKYAEMPDEGKGRILVVFDVNHLKYVNDNFGHSMGDRLLVTSYEFIETFFGTLGRLYRIGGDEFVLITEPMLKEKDKEGLNLACTKFDKALHTHNTVKENQFPIHIAYGACCVGEDYSTLQDAFNEADRLMYIYKKQLKEKYPEFDVRKGKEDSKD